MLAPRFRVVPLQKPFRMISIAWSIVSARWMRSRSSGLMVSSLMSSSRWLLSWEVHSHPIIRGVMGRPSPISSKPPSASTTNSWFQDACLSAGPRTGFIRIRSANFRLIPDRDPIPCSPDHHRPESGKADSGRLKRRKDSLDPLVAPALAEGPHPVCPR